jgi:hypothetical protein
MRVFFKPFPGEVGGRSVRPMSTTDPFTNHRNDDAVAAANPDENAAERPEQNRSALNEVAHPFDQTNGIVEDVDHRQGVTHNNDEQLDADPDVDADTDRTEDDDEPGRESPADRRPLVNTTLIAEEIFGDDEKKKPRFD